MSSITPTNQLLNKQGEIFKPLNFINWVDGLIKFGFENGLIQSDVTGNENTVIPFNKLSKEDQEKITNINQSFRAQLERLSDQSSFIKDEPEPFVNLQTVVDKNLLETINDQHLKNHDKLKSVKEFTNKFKAELPLKLSLMLIEISRESRGHSIDPNKFQDELNQLETLILKPEIKAELEETYIENPELAKAYPNITNRRTAESNNSVWELISRDIPKQETTLRKIIDADRNNPVQTKMISMADDSLEISYQRDNNSPLGPDIRDRNTISIRQDKNGQIKNIKVSRSDYFSENNAHLLSA